MADDSDRPPPPASPSWQQVAEGLLYTHGRLNENTKANLEAASFLYGLVELLEEKKVISIAELDQRKHEVSQRLARKNNEKGIGVLLQEPETDQYTFAAGATIDCENRVALCKAACCRLPYLIAQDDTGHCVHLDRGCHRCTIHEQRPVPCRGYDCRNDRRIWLDFANRIVNPDIRRDDWPRGLSMEDARSPQT